VHFFRDPVIAYAILLYFIDLFEILMAHYVIVAAKGLDDVGFSVVMNNYGFREIPPSASWYT
jgi:hypothetical protein